MLIRRQIPYVIATGSALLVGSATLGLLHLDDSSASAVGARGPVAPLSVRIDDQRTGAAGGERLTYTIRVRNDGPASVSAARISQRLPAALEPVTASPGGMVSRSEASWTMDVPAGTEVAVSLTALVGSSRNDYPRLVTTGCVGSAGASTVCSSDINALRLPPRSQLGTWLLLGFLSLLAAIGGGLWRWVTHSPAPQRPRRSSRRTTAGSGGSWKPRPLAPIAATYATAAAAIDDLAGVFVPSAVRAAVGRLPDHTTGQARSPPRRHRRCERPSRAGIDVLRAIARLRLGSARSARSVGSPLAGRRHCRYG